MKRVIMQKSTGKIIEMQSGGDAHPTGTADSNKVYAANNLQTLINNAIAAGYAANDIEAKFVSDADWAQMSGQTTAPLIYCKWKVRTKADVDRITAQQIVALGEAKAKTAKLQAGSNDCPVWDTFVAARAVILQKGNDFISANKLT